MDSLWAILFELLFSGAAIAFGLWQLHSLRRDERRDRASTGGEPDEDR